MPDTMQRRLLGKTGWDVSVIGFGAWQIGGDWGAVDEATAIETLHAAADSGINFFDTADVYGDGRSEQLIGRFLREHDGDPYVATKMGRRAPLELKHYTLENMRAWANRSRRNLGVDRLGLVQLHCLPRGVYDSPQIFESLDALVADEVIEHYGVSVETTDEAMRAMKYPGVATVQVIFNVFRQKPAHELLRAADDAGVGIIARVPLASGLLTGNLTHESQFDETDHRHFNRHGEAFDVGETFAGVEFHQGVNTVERLRPLSGDEPLVHFALRWILTHSEVSTTIPGARNVTQARSNAEAGMADPLDEATMAKVARIYRDDIAELVADRW